MVRIKIWEDCKEELKNSIKDPIHILSFIPPWDGNKTKLVLKCELHGTWETTTVANLKKRGTCPKCARLRSTEKQISKWEDEIVACEQVKKEGIKIIGFIPPYQGTRTKLRLCCEEHGEWSTTAIAQFKKRGCCPKCSKINVGKINSKTDEMHINEFFKTGSFKKGCKFWRSPTLNSSGFKSYWYHTCPICSNDEYVQNGLCSGVFESHMSHLKKGLCRCRCGDFPTYTEEQQDFRTRLKCKELGYVFIERKGKFVTYLCPKHGIMNAYWQNIMKGHKCKKCSNLIIWRERKKNWRDYKKECQVCVDDGIIIKGYVEPWNGCFTKLICECPEHGEWTTTSITTRITRLVGCPQCVGKSQKECYLNSIKDKNVDLALKFGIAKNSAMRLRIQNWNNLFQMEQIGVWEFKTVEDCKEAEKECKSKLKCGVLTSRELKDGFSETVALTDCDEVVRIYESWGGIRIK